MVTTSSREVQRGWRQRTIDALMASHAWIVVISLLLWFADALVEGVCNISTTIQLVRQPKGMQLSWREQLLAANISIVRLSLDVVLWIFFITLLWTMAIYYQQSRDAVFLPNAGSEARENPPTRWRMFLACVPLVLVAFLFRSMWLELRRIVASGLFEGWLISARSEVCRTLLLITCTGIWSDLSPLSRHLKKQTSQNYQRDCRLPRRSPR